MAIIANLVVALTARTDQFQGGLRGAIRSLGSLQSNILRVAAVFGGLQFIRTSVQAFGEQEQATRRLADALGLLGVGSTAAVQDMLSFAEGVQNVTTVSDETVLGMAALGASLGKLSGESLKQAVIAAIGLSKALRIDTHAAMQLVAKAAQGNTATLSRYGIVLDSTLTPQEKFAKVLEKGSQAFAIATGEAQTATGRIEQFKNQMNEVQEAMGAAFAAVAGPLMQAFQGILESLREHATTIVQVVLAIAQYLAIMKLVRIALRGVAIAQAIVNALSGPAGWIKLAVGAAAAVAAIILVEKTFGDLNSKVDDATASLTAFQDASQLSQSQQRLAQLQEQQSQALAVGNDHLAVQLGLVRANEEAYRDWLLAREDASRLDAAEAERITALDANLQKLVDDLNKEIEGLQAVSIAEQIATAASEGASAALVEEALRRNELAESLRLSGDIDALTTDLQRQIDTFGMSATQIALYELALRGATAAQLELARALAVQLEKLERQAELQREAERVFEETRTPLEQYQEEIRKLEELLREGFIDQETFERATRKAREELERTQQTMKPLDMEAERPTPGEFREVRLSRIALDAATRPQRTIEDLTKEQNQFLADIKSLLENPRPMPLIWSEN